MLGVLFFVVYLVLAVIVIARAWYDDYVVHEREEVKATWAKEHPYDYWHSAKWGFEGWALGSLLFALTTIVAGMISLGLFALTATWPIDQTSPYHTRYIDIASLNDGSSVEGHFFLGSGYVDGKMVYNYYTEDNGTFHLYSKDADEADVRYTDDKPRIEFRCRNYNESKWKWTAWPVPMGFIVNDAEPGISCGTDPHYTFYVPSGSVKTNFNLDAQ